METKYQNLIKKAESGDVEALIDLSCAYFEGEVTGSAEIGKGMVCIEKAAEISGSPFLQRKCASMYSMLELENQAILWYKKAAINGDAESQAKLSRYYFAGCCVEEDHNQALYWAKKAYDQGEASESAVILGTLYLQGKVVKQDVVSAYRMFKLAAQNGNDQAEPFAYLIEKQFPNIKNS